MFFARVLQGAMGAHICFFRVKVHADSSLSADKKLRIIMLLYCC